MFLRVESKHGRGGGVSTRRGRRGHSVTCVCLCFYALRHTSGSGVKTHTHDPMTLPCVLLAERQNVFGLDSAGNLSKSKSGGLPG